MTESLIEAATALAEALAAENTALLAMDFTRAAQIAPDKAAALAALQAARDAQALAGLSPARRAVADELGTKLRLLAQENRRLLECAMQVQGRVMRCIASALPAALPEGLRYAPNGAITQNRGGVPLSLHARV